MRVGESHGHSRVGWAGALEAPSRGRCVMVPCVTVAVETVAARRAAREQNPPIKWTLPCTQFCVTKAAARNLALFSCQIWVYKNEG